MRRACHFDVASGHFKYHFGALMWPCSALKKPSWTLKKETIINQVEKKNKAKKYDINLNSECEHNEDYLEPHLDI